jgi:transposase InsO family protein
LIRPDYREGFLNGKRYLIMDRDTKFCDSFRSILEQSDIQPVILPPRSPNLNAYIERFVRSLKSECLGRMIFFGENSLRTAVRQFLDHYHEERNHQGLENKIIDPGEGVEQTAGTIQCRERLGGMLRYYYRDAA